MGRMELNSIEVYRAEMGQAALQMKMSHEQHVGPERVFVWFPCHQHNGSYTAASHAEPTRKAC